MADLSEPLQPTKQYRIDYGIADFVLDSETPRIFGDWVDQFDGSLAVLDAVGCTVSTPSGPRLNRIKALVTYQSTNGSPIPPTIREVVSALDSAICAQVRVGPCGGPGGLFGTTGSLKSVERFDRGDAVTLSCPDSPGVGVPTPDLGRLSGFVKWGAIGIVGLLGVRVVQAIRK